MRWPSMLLPLLSVATPVVACSSTDGAAPASPASDISTSTPEPGTDDRSHAPSPGAPTSPAGAHNADASAPPPSQCKSPLPTTKVHLPADDAPHARESMEWWYWTGHLKTADGRWFGFEEVFFRAKVAGAPGHMVHSALTDIHGNSFHHFSMPGIGDLATGSNGFAFTFAEHTAKGGDGHDTLHAQGLSYAFDLDLMGQKRPVLQHHEGYTDYPFGGYTYYYSRERMAVKGTLSVDGEKLDVTGTGWFDHQYGNIDAAVRKGWDWFALQLDDDREMMLFVVRDQGKQVLVGASVTGPDCVTTEVPPAEVEVTSLGTWRSPHTTCTYPAGWNVKVRGETFVVKPYIADQEVYTSTPVYWEGASSVSGSATGRAYVELNGYCPQL